MIMGSPHVLVQYLLRSFIYGSRSQYISSAKSGPPSRRRRRSAPAHLYKRGGDSSSCSSSSRSHLGAKLTRCLSAASGLTHRPALVKILMRQASCPPKGHLPVHLVGGAHAHSVDVLNPDEVDDAGRFGLLQGHTSQQQQLDDGHLLYFVKAEHLNHPLLAELLHEAALEFGYSQSGILRLPCDPSTFEDILHRIAKPLC